MLGLPPSIQLNLPSRNHLTTKVPKGHIRAHDDSCHGPQSLSYTNGAGMTDGEGIERLWSWLNKAAPSAKEMTLSARHELLDDFCRFTNWRKTIGLCDTLSRRMLEAIKQAKIHREEFLAFNARVQERVPEQLREWEHMVDMWKQDNSNPCPYTSTQPRMYILY